MRYKIFGCKVNKFFAEKWLSNPNFKNLDGIFVLTCVVTDKAKKKWVKFILDCLKELQDGEKVYISGCGAFDKGEVDKDFLKKYSSLAEFSDKIVLLPESANDFDISNKGINPLVTSQVTDFNKEFKPLVTSKGIYTKKFVLVQYGCDSNCTYCLTVKKRGKHASRDKDEILDEIKDFEAKGGKEIVITGINIGAWGMPSTNDFAKPKFHELLSYILEKTNIPRIKISSLGIEFVDDKLLKLFENSRITPHFHYSIQSGSDKILKLMGRHYGSKEVKNVLKKTRALKREDGVGISIGADLIVGFPGETQEDFTDSCDLVSDFQITKLHAFSFSAHHYADSVPASKLPNQIEDKIIRERYRTISQIGEKVRNDFIASQKGIELEVLLETVKDGGFKGWTQNYIEVNEQNFKIVSGEIVKNGIVKGKLV